MVALILSLISLVLSFYAVYVSNKPYLVKLFLIESGCRENCFCFSITNVGREVFYPKSIKILDINTGESYGETYFRIEGKKMFSIAPGEIKRTSVCLSSNYPYHYEIDVNPFIEVVIEDMKGKKTFYHDIFGVG